MRELNKEDVTNILESLDVQIKDLIKKAYVTNPSMSRMDDPSQENN